MTAPPHGNIAPPGYYMLFLLNRAGVPSHAQFVRLVPAAPNQPPVASITNPSTNVTVNPGGSISFAGFGSDADGSIAAYDWTFPGGVPNSSSSATPGNVSYATPGSYVASLTVTDDKGLASQPATRTITVANFTVTATPSSQAVIAGQSATFTATVTPASGFTGTVDFSVAGLPAGATATFSPTSVSGSGSSSVLVSTSAATPSGTYTLTLRGTSGPLTRTADVTLVVNGDFSIAVSPTSRTISRGGSTTYSVAITAGAGFSGGINLMVDGVPSRATGTFNPASLAGSGTSVLTVSTQRNVQKGTRTLVITASGGGRTHSANVTLVIR
jgi:PKD repeat protein